MPTQLWPAERTLLARAWLRSGETSRAFDEFSRLQVQTPLADWHVFAIHDFAVSAVRVRRFDIAAGCYRRLTSLSQWLPLQMRIAITLEAASALLHTAPTRALEALGLVTELERASVDPNVSFVATALRMVASAALDPSQPLAPLPSRDERFRLPAYLRLVEEDVEFLQSLSRYQALGRWPDEPSEGAAASSLQTSSTYGALVSRLRAGE